MEARDSRSGAGCYGRMRIGCGMTYRVRTQTELQVRIDTNLCDKENKF